MNIERKEISLVLTILMMKDGEDEHSDKTSNGKIRMRMVMSPFPPLAKRDRLRKSGVLRFAGDGKPLQNNLRAGQQAFSLMAISFPRSKTSTPN